VGGETMTIEFRIVPAQPTSEGRKMEYQILNGLTYSKVKLMINKTIFDTCDFEEGPNKVKANHIFELGMLEARLNAQGINDMSDFLHGCVDHQSHE
jgi:hypothetical protein